LSFDGRARLGVIWPYGQGFLAGFVGALVEEPRGSDRPSTYGGVVSDKSSIEWTGATWNPTTGCDRISAGCDHCYALTLAKRLKAAGVEKYQADGDPRTSGPGFALTVHESALDIPRRWKRPRTIFVNSMSDLFHARVPDEFLDKVVETMRATPQHRYQILTKRGKRLLRASARLQWPENAWLGVSIESPDHLDRLEDLRTVSASVRFLSLEPLLAPLPNLNLDGIDWVIVGGESGPGARPMEAEWVRSLRDQCVAAKVPFFMKQWGGRTPKIGGRELDGRTWDEMPVPQPNRLTSAEGKTGSAA
jgi:protein gp37